jgi:tetratricopeptide (TPR) repeat protein
MTPRLPRIASTKEHSFMRSITRRFLFLGALALISAPGLAAAAKPGAAPEGTQAKEHYVQATKLYDLGKYDEAIKEFEAAFEIKDDPVLLYNIAQAYRLANKYPEALRFYRTYLRRKPKAANRAEVETKIADMENLIAEQNRVANGPPIDPIAPGAKPGTTPGGTVQQTTPPRPNTAGTEGEPPADPNALANTTPTDPAKPVVVAPPTVPPAPPAPPSPPPTPGNSKLDAGIALAVVGIGVAGGGVGLGVMAMSASSQQQKNTQFDPGLDSNGKLYQTLGLALDVAGGVVAVTGVILAAVGARQNSRAAEKHVSFVPSVSPGYVGAAARVAF